MTSGPTPYLALSIFILGSTAASAAGGELFTPLPSGQLKDVRAAQTARVDKIKQRPTTASITLVNVNTSALLEGSTRMSLPNAKAFDFSRSNMDKRNANDFTWEGTLPDFAGSATLVVHGNEATGSIRADGKLYRIEPLGNGVHALVKVDESRFPKDHPPSFKDKEKQRGAMPGRPEATHGPPASGSPVGINVLVAYTTAARGAVNDMGATVQLAVAETNQSYRNSKINIDLRLVDSFEVPYSESGKTFEEILADFVGMASVATRRNSSNAALAALIINKADYCGLADAIQASAATAFAVVYYDCATGYYSFGHELGHLQGARHDPATDPSTTPFAYGHGFQHLSPPPSWRTIMAYDCPGGCPRLQYWANPHVSYNGAAMGAPVTSDDARVLNETAATVAGFKPHP